MKQLKDFKQEIHKCSKCGLCQKVCPIYQVTGNDCTVSRGQFIMLKGVLNGKFEMTKTLNKYLSLCLKCGKCSEFCPSGIDAVDIISCAKSEYFKKHFTEKIISYVQKYIIFGILTDVINLFTCKKQSKKFDKKVIYFGGCKSKYTGNAATVKLLNSLKIEVITPNFSCCGIPFFVRGDFDTYKIYMQNYIKLLKKSGTKDIITTCASCEKSIKNYIKWCDSEEDRKFLSELNVKNIYEYLHESNAEFVLKKPVKATYHKPCNQDNYEAVKHLLTSTKNLDYIEAEGFDRCCGLNGIFNFSGYKIFSRIFKNKRDSIISTGAEYAITTCFGCETALRIYSFGKYKTSGLIEFLSKNIISE